MNIYNLWLAFLNYLWSWVDGAGYICSEIMQNMTIDFGGGNIFSPLLLISFGGLTFYLGVAIVKWILS